MSNPSTSEKAKLVATATGALLSMSVSLIQPAHGWEAGVERDIFMEACGDAPRNGADLIVLRFKSMNGFFGQPVLAGLKEGKTLWTRSLPDAEELNVAKLSPKCRGSRGRKGVVIDVASQYPGNSPWFVQRFRWDGETVKKLGEWVRK